MKTVEQALDLLLSQASCQQEIITLPLHQAHGKILAEDIIAPMDVPAFALSTMDGYALYGDYAPHSQLEISQRITAGDAPQPLTPGTAARIFTGAPIPLGADRVVPQEYTQMHGDLVKLIQPPSPGDSIRQPGSDLAKDARILQMGEKITPQALGLIASLGMAQVRVYKPLRLVFFTTGNELLSPGEPWQPGKIYNSNRFLIQGLLGQLGYEYVDMGQVEDTLAATQDALKVAGEMGDVIITTGGVSVGEEDHIKAAVESLGEIHMWKVQMKPGKPFTYGKLLGKTFLGLPGNPVSAFTTLGIFALPLIKKLGGQNFLQHKTLPAIAAFDWRKPDTRREYLRAQLDEDGKVHIHSNQNSGVLSSTHWADGLVIIPENTQVKAGDRLAFLPYAWLYR